MRRLLGVSFVLLIASAIGCYTNSSNGGDSPVMPMPSPPIAQDYPMVIDFKNLPDGPISAPVNMGGVIVDGDAAEVAGGEVNISLGSLEVTTPNKFCQAAVLVKEMDGQASTVIEGLDGSGDIMTMTVSGPPGNYTYIRLLGSESNLRKVRVRALNAKVKKMIIAAPLWTVGFKTTTPLTTSWQISKMVVSDFNNDGRPDLAISNNNQGALKILLGDGKGKLKETAALLLSGPAKDLEAADMDGNGFNDLVALTADGVAIFTNLNGEFVSGGEYGSFTNDNDMAIGDLNADGLPDVVVAAQDGLYSMTGSIGGVLEAPQLISAIDARTVAVNDMDGDTTPDIIVGKASPAEIQVWLGDGAFGFALYDSISLLSDPKYVAAAPFDWDDYPDVAALLSGSPNWQTFTNDGSGALWTHQAFQATNGFAPQFVMADINNDGFADMGILDADNDELDIFTSDILGNFIIADRIKLTGTPNAIAAGDLAKDGKTDLTVGGFNGEIWINENISQ